MPENRPQPYTARQEQIANVAIKIMSALNTWVYRATGGKIGGKFLRGAPVMLLTTTGRKSGRTRTAPLIYLEDGENLVVAASKAGSARQPLWYRNLQANPDVEVEIGAKKRLLRARTAGAEEKAKFWPRLTVIYPDYDDYQARTERDIPVVILEPR